MLHINLNATNSSLTVYPKTKQNQNINYSNAYITEVVQTYVFIYYLEYINVSQIYDVVYTPSYIYDTIPIIQFSNSNQIWFKGFKVELVIPKSLNRIKYESNIDPNNVKSKSESLRISKNQKYLIK